MRRTEIKVMPFSVSYQASVASEQLISKILEVPTFQFVPQELIAYSCRKVYSEHILYDTAELQPQFLSISASCLPPSHSMLLFEMKKENSVCCSGHVALCSLMDCMQPARLICMQFSGKNTESQLVHLLKEVFTSSGEPGSPALPQADFFHSLSHDQVLLPTRTT